MKMNWVRKLPIETSKDGWGLLKKNMNSPVFEVRHLLCSNLPVGVWVKVMVRARAKVGVKVRVKVKVGVKVRFTARVRVKVGVRV